MDGKYNFKHMEQTSELDYQISVMQAKKEGKVIERCTKELDFSKNWKEDNFDLFNFEKYLYKVKPEPPQPKTVPFSFEDADFLFGLKVRDRLYSYMMVTGVEELKFYLNGVPYKFDGDERVRNLEYQDPTTQEWKPFVKVIV